MLDRSLAPRRLVLIDDSAPFRQTLARLLRVAGHMVWEAESGAAGLALLRQHPLDLVVTARDMPGVTGWNIARLVKAMVPQLPVVLVAGGTDSAAPDRRTAPHVEAILWKPFPLAELLAVIGRLTWGDTSAPGGAKDASATGQWATQVHHAVHTPGAPGGAGAAAGPRHRWMRRHLVSSGR